MSKVAEYLDTRFPAWRRLLRAGGVLGAGIAIASVFVLLFATQPSFLRQLDYKVYDALLRSSEHGSPHPAPLIVDIDEASLEKCGQWPWPRYMMAELAAKLTDLGAAAIGFDILFAEADRSSPTRVRTRLEHDFGVHMTLDSIPENLRDYDRLLADTLKQTPSVIAVFVGSSGSDIADGEILPPPCIAAEMKPAGSLPPRTFLRRRDNAILPINELRGISPGFINVTPDDDGIIRSAPLLVELKGKIYASLALRTVMQALRVKNLVLMSSPDGLAAIHIGKTVIPVRPDGSMPVPFRGGRKTYQYISAADILGDRVPREAIEGRIAFVGTSAMGLQDLRAMPFSAAYPGVETHAAVTDSILSNRHIVSPPWTPGAQAAAIMAAGCIAALFCGLASAWAYMPVGFLLAGGAVWGSMLLFDRGIYISPLYAVLTVVAEMLLLIALRFMQEEKQKKVLRAAFSHYVSPEIVSRIAASGRNLLGGEQREVTLVFTDIRGFTSISESLQPQQVTALLNRYFTPMTACIHSRGGTLDKFIGDAIMAFWNAPLNVPNHPEQALLTVLEMHSRLAELNTSIEQDFGIALRIGAGVNTGVVQVGNMGSQELFDYTCIGDEVNLASRLEGMSSKYGVGIVASEATKQRYEEDRKAALDTLPQSARGAAQKDNLFFRRLDTIRVKGKTQPVNIYTVLCRNEAEERRDEFERAEKAFALYADGDFAEAAPIFRELAEHFGISEKLYLLYAERCENLAQNPPETWDGIWTYSVK